MKNHPEERQSAINDYLIMRARTRAIARGAKTRDIERNVALFDDEEFPVRMSPASVFHTSRRSNQNA